MRCRCAADASPAPDPVLVPRACPDFLAGVEGQLLLAGLQLRVLHGLRHTVGPLAARIAAMADREVRSILRTTGADVEAMIAGVAGLGRPAGTAAAGPLPRGRHWDTSPTMAGALMLPAAVALLVPLCLKRGVSHSSAMQS